MNTPNTIESLIRYCQHMLNEEMKSKDDKTLAISCAGLFREWVPGKYEEGDIRTKDNIPYECRQNHDNAVNPDWTIDVRTIWKPYHSREKKWALPFIHPTCADDMYKSGEYMIYTDGKTYLCKADTNFSPEEYAAAWEVQDD